MKNSNMSSIEDLNKSCACYCPGDGGGCISSCGASPNQAIAGKFSKSATAGGKQQQTVG